jgi:hypothetical protein
MGHSSFAIDQPEELNPVPHPRIYSCDLSTGEPDQLLLAGHGKGHSVIVIHLDTSSYTACSLHKDEITIL